MKLTPTQPQAITPKQIHIQPKALTPSNNSNTTPTLTPKQLKQKYINETIKLISTKHHLKDYIKERLSNKISLIYDEVVNQLVNRRIQGQGNRLYSFNFDKSLYNNTVIRIMKQTHRVWRLMQDHNPLLRIEFGNYYSGKKILRKESIVAIEYPGLENVINELYRDDNVIVKVLQNPRHEYDHIEINSLTLMFMLSDVDSLVELDLDHDVKQVKTLIRVQNLLGYIPHPIKMHISGRKYYGGRYLNLQNCNRLIRNVAFAGCQELDINNCLNSYMIEQAHKYNIDDRIFTFYRDHKSQVRKDITEQVFGLINNERQKIIKKALSGLAYRNSKLSDVTEKNYHYVNMVMDESFDLGEYHAFQTHSFVQEYMKQSIAINKQILKSKRVQSFRGNPQYRDLHVEKNTSRRLKRSAVLAFLYFEYETQAMKTAFKGLEHKIRLSIHDGVILDPLLTQELDLVKSRFAEMQLSVKVMTL